jgi:acetolactate synthase small subunit
MEIFNTNPKLEKCFKTSDGEHFYNESDAKNHAKSLEDKHVEKLINPEFISEQADQKQDESLEGNEDGDEILSEMAKNHAMADALLNLELSTNNYQEMKRLVKHFGIEVADSKAETLISAINEYKSKLHL